MHFIRCILCTNCRRFVQSKHPLTFAFRFIIYLSIYCLCPPCEFFTSGALHSLELKFFAML